MKYPNNIHKQKDKDTHVNRGMNLERIIDSTNTYYKKNNIALIYKKPTPIKVTKIQNLPNNKCIIKEGFFQSKSTTDYNGVYNSKYIDFEAKETKNKTFFPINNIHKHQLNHMEEVIKHKGISFIIFCFYKLNIFYFIKSEDVLKYIKENPNTNIKIEWFNKNGYIIKEKINPRLDYIQIIKELYEK